MTLPNQLPQVILTALVWGTFSAALTLSLTHALPDNATALNLLLGALAAHATTTVSYWVGSSSGSASKNAALFASLLPPATS